MDDFIELLRDNKWEILKVIALKPSSATEIAEYLKTSTSNITQQLKILEAYKFVSSQKSKEKSVGKPKIIYSLSQESAYVAVLGQGVAEKNSIKLEGFNKSLFNIISLSPEDTFFILKFMFKNEELLKKCKGIAYLRSTRDAVELFLLTDHVDEIRAKFSNLFIEDINGKTKKIINWTHNEYEIKDGMHRRDKYFMDMLKHIKIIHDPYQILMNSKATRGGIMNKTSKFIDELSEEELELFEKEMKEGYVQKYVDRKKEFFKVKDKICPVCGNMVEPDCYVLIWGEPSVRKKAHFCGRDCLQYFLNRNNLQEKKPEKNSKKRDQNASKKTETTI